MTYEFIWRQSNRKALRVVDMISMPNCWICGRNVSVRESNIDENGFAVHEACYVAKLALEEGQSQISEAVKMLRKFIRKKSRRAGADHPIRMT